MVKSRRSLKHVIEQPRYVEAYPRLDIMQAKTAFERGEPICEFTDRFHQPLGLAWFDLQADRCLLEHKFRFPSTDTQRGWELFELIFIQEGEVKNRLMLLCPDCDEQKKILFFKGKWRCASCLKLRFRSQLIHPLARKWEKIDTLANSLKYGKPHGMHNKTYIGLLGKLETLREKVYDKERIYASDKYSDYVKCTWRSSTLRDDHTFPYVRANLEYLEQLKAEREIATGMLGSPNPSNDRARREFRGGFEPNVPDDL